jgi:hypothetical protein
MIHETDLGRAQRHVHESAARVARQRVLVERLRTQGWNVGDGEWTLRQFEELHAIYQQRLFRLMDRTVIHPPVETPRNRDLNG